MNYRLIRNWLEDEKDKEEEKHKENKESDAEIEWNI